MNRDFLDNIRNQLGAEADDFFRALNCAPKSGGLRINTLKAQPIEFCDQLDILLSPIPWCPSGFYYPLDEKKLLSKNPLYHAGLYYLQEPSAMAPVELLAPKPGDAVLDLCAAPGGKSVQIAGYLQNKGLLVSNDASASRSRALVKNLTLAGVRNAIIFIETPKRLHSRFGEFFDKILVDAPCSGEGMFRKDPDAIKAWNANKPASCVPVQREILHYAAAMLKPGGHIVYSTCTFNQHENEGVIDSFLNSHPDFEHITTERLWPHKIEGEGHFICKMQKTLGAPPQTKTLGALPPTPRKLLKKFDQNFDFGLTFGDGEVLGFDFLESAFWGAFVKHNDALYLQQGDLPDLSGLRVARSMWYLGEIKKARRSQHTRFEPSHAFALGLTPSEVKFTYDMLPEMCKKYLAGESFYAETSYPSKSWVLMCYKGFSLGWARYVDGRLKNRYPHGWMMSG